MARTLLRVLSVMMVTNMTLAAVAIAQPVEVRPADVPDPKRAPTLYRSDDAPNAEIVKYRMASREEARKKDWPEEAARIARFRQNVVRDEDELYIYLDAPNFPRAVVFRNIWGLDPGVIYTYRAFDDVGKFHIVDVGLVDNEGHVLLISAETGLIYRIDTTNGALFYSPSKTRFLTSGFPGMGCLSGVSIYKYDMDKMFLEAQQSMGCDQSCSHEWWGSDEVRSICANGTGTGKVEYRLISRGGTWQATRTELPR